LDRLDVRLRIPEGPNRHFRALGQTFPLLVFVTRLAPRRTWELGAYLRQLVAELYVSKRGDGLDGLADGVGVQQAAVMQLLPKPRERRPSLSPRACAKDGKDGGDVVDALDRKASRAARAQAPKKRRVCSDLSRWSHRRMPSGLGVDALGADLLEVACRHRSHQSPSDFPVVGIRRAPELFTRVRILIARNALSQAKLERIQISFRVVRHVTVLRIDSRGGDPPI
jgi:hypothetical protein